MAVAGPRRVLLMRPHDFMVDDVTAWLKGFELDVVRFQALSDAEHHAPTDVRCCVVSTAATSPVACTVAEALKVARTRFPNARLFIASLSSFERSRAALELDAKGLGLTFAPPDGTATWQLPSVSLFVPRDFLKGPRRPELDQAARAALGL